MNLPNVAAANLVRIGIGGWTGNYAGLKVPHERERAEAERNRAAEG